ncbi:MAG: DUF2853 family protein [Flavobacteriaceae bacterium]
MSQFYQKIDQYKDAMLSLGIECDQQLLTAVTKGLGPSIYKTEAETVSGNCAEELQTVKTNFLRKKLGLFDSQRIDEAINSVILKMGKSNDCKYRAIFYYLLVKELRKEYIYEKAS